MLMIIVSASVGGLVCLLLLYFAIRKRNERRRRARLNHDYLTPARTTESYLDSYGPGFDEEPRQDLGLITTGHRRHQRLSKADIRRNYDSITL